MFDLFDLLDFIKLDLFLVLGIPTGGVLIIAQSFANPKSDIRAL